MNDGEAAKLVSLALAAYPSQAGWVDVPSTIEAWASLLSDVDFAAAEAAVRVLAQTERKMPSIADIRATCLELAHGPKRPGVDAWGDVIALRTFTDVTTMTSVDPITLHACKQFGWIEYRTLTRNGVDIEQWHVVSGENEAADRKRFIDEYDALKAQVHRESVAPILAEARATRARQLPGNPFQLALESATAQCEHGTVGCAGRGEKHACIARGGS